MMGGASAGMSQHKAEGLFSADDQCSSNIAGLYAAGDALGSIRNVPLVETILRPPRSRDDTSSKFQDICGFVCCFFDRETADMEQVAPPENLSDGNY